MRLFNPGSSQRSPIVDMIEFLPETYKVEVNSARCPSAVVCIRILENFHLPPQQHLLDTCVRESDDDHNCPNYHVSFSPPTHLSRTKLRQCSHRFLVPSMHVAD